MTEEEIIKLAIEHTVSSLKFDEDGILRFAKLIAEHEREACAKVCETHGVHPALNVWNGGPDWYKHGKDCAETIRARGQA